MSNVKWNNWIKGKIYTCETQIGAHKILKLKYVQFAIMGIRGWSYLIYEQIWSARAFMNNKSF